jgi:glycosyltransferase involved in cell wall biosynthesis
VDFGLPVAQNHYSLISQKAKVNMSVCIGMPVYNDSAYIEESIACLKRQSHTDFVCLINDDVSTDDTREVVRRCIDGDERFVFICQEFNGGGLNNEATLTQLQKTRFRRKYTFPFSGHDLVSDNYLEDAVVFLEKNPDYSISTGQMRSFEGVTENARDMPEASYEFFQTTGLLAFINSAFQLVNCTVYNSVRRSDFLFEKDVFPIWEPMRGADHLIISWMASYGRINVSRQSAYLRRMFPAEVDCRPDMSARLMGVSCVEPPSQDLLSRAMVNHYLRIFRIRFAETMSAEESGRFEQLIFDSLYRRFLFNLD